MYVYFNILSVSARVPVFCVKREDFANHLIQVFWSLEGVVVILTFMVLNNYNLYILKIAL